MEAPASMMHLSRALNGIDKALQAGEEESLAEHIRALQRAGGELADLEPQKNEGLVEVFDAYRVQLAQLASELDTAADQREKMPRIIAEIRHTCVRCHVKFAVDADLYYPNVGNIISGRVSVLDQQGTARDNRSNILVFLDQVPGTHLPPRHRPALSQKERRFAPRVLPVVKGTTVDFPNDDRIFHNVFSLSQVSPFDLDIYPPGESGSYTFEETGWIKIYCNIHSGMIAHILVLDNGFFSLTDEQGLFVIPDVPDGAYQLRVWHELGGGIDRPIEVVGDTLYSLQLQLREDRRILRHKNKFGKPYPERY